MASAGKNDVYPAPRPDVSSHGRSQPETAPTIDHLAKNWPISDRIRRDIINFENGGGLENENDNSYDELMAALERYTGFPQESILPVAGNQAAYWAIVNSFIRESDELIMDGPIMTDFEKIATTRGGRVVYHKPPAPETRDLSGIMSSMNHATRMVYLAHPNWCTGSVIESGELERILKGTFGIQVILDESYFEFFGSSLAGFLRQYDNLSVVRSFAHGFGLKGLASSYILASPENRCRLMARAAPERPSQSAMYASTRVLGDLDWISRRLEAHREYLLYVTTRLRSLGVTVHSSKTGLLLLEVPAPEAVAAALHDASVDIRSLDLRPSLKNRLAVDIADDAAGLAVIDAFRAMPAHYYRLLQPRRATITLRRRTESDKRPNASSDRPIIGNDHAE